MLSLVMEKTMAWEVLNDPEQSSRLTALGVYEMMVLAGYPEEEAQRAMSERGMQRLADDKVV